MTGSCICGAVVVTIESKPDFVHDCNCSLCRKAGAAWGYFGSAEVVISGATIGFARSDKAIPGVEVHSCRRCSATTHFELTSSYRERHETADQVGVNMRIFDPDELIGVEIRFPDGKAWSGKGPFGYRRAAMTISERLPW